jgi:tRNA G10  N-methylase Trm11
MVRMLSRELTSYVFIPGKNWKLSLAELVSFLKAREHGFKIISRSRPFFVVNTQAALDPHLIEDLGGFVKIGLVRARVPLTLVEEAFLHRRTEAQKDIKAALSVNCPVNEIFRTPLQKCVFGVSLYFEDSRFRRSSKEMQRFVGSYFKEQLAAQAMKAKFMGFPKTREFPQLTHVEVLKKGLIEKSAEILFCIGRERALIANTIAVHNPFEFQKRDIDRPVQRKIFSIPPRLAKIMVNLSLCLPGKVLLDPFCGVGTVLQEAMLMKAQTIGMDINPWCVEACSKNLDWIKREYSPEGATYMVMLGDARNSVAQVGEKTVDCIATEPDLGPALRHFPTKLHAERIIDRLKPLYYDFVEEAYKILKDRGMLVFVTPYVKTRSRAFVPLDIREKAEATGFEIVCPFEKRIFAEDSELVEELATASSFIDIEERHKIGREIHILQK